MPLTLPRLIRVGALLLAALGGQLGALPATRAAVAPYDRSFDLSQLGADGTFTAERGFGFDLGLPPLGDRPFYFSAAVPEGNYRVTVTFGSEASAGSTTVRAESRQLLAEEVAAPKGGSVEQAYTVNVRSPELPAPPRNAPGGTHVLLNPREGALLRWDDKLTLEFSGRAPRVRHLRIQAVSTPTLFLVGDSTVTDQPAEPGASWGQMLPRFFNGQVAIANHAESGETLKSFLSGLRLAKVLSQLKAGDTLLVQFGHNDQKAQWPQTYVEAATTYQAYLKVFVAEARLRGATPVLVTSVQRRTFDGAGRITNSHGDYPEAVRVVAREEGVALIDLHEASTRLYEALGPERAPLAFSDHGRDPTHHNNYGAYQLARAVVQGLRDAGVPVAQHLRADVPRYDASQPDPPETFYLAPSPERRFETPRGN